VATYDSEFNMSNYHGPVSNGYLLSMMEDLESGDPERVLRAQLQLQPGAYACSIPAIDRMVDIATSTPGVAGAQLAGAGLGGCMMVLALKSAIPELIKRLKKQYYAPAGLKDSILVCNPVAGAGLIKIAGN
jgi:galactokinase